LTTPENEQTPADQKLKAKEMIGLANAAAGISRVLREADRDTAERGKETKKTGKSGTAWD
jgi:hypothetical protein